MVSPNERMSVRESTHEKRDYGYCSWIDGALINVLLLITYVYVSM